MTEQEIERIRGQIESLPKGAIYRKKIRGKSYEYWQFREDGKQVSRRVKGEELEILQQQIAERRRLEGILQQAGVRIPKRREAAAPEEKEPVKWHTAVRYGEELLRFTEPVRNFRTREIFGRLTDYLYAPVNDRVFILYGLRRTGKTTMIRQAILQMDEDHRSRTAFIQITPGDTMAELNRDLRKLEDTGFRYIFLDEVTLLEDFIEGAAIFSDIFAASGMKLVLSGTDSLGFLFSEDEQLYDRCIMLHTTFIPYREFEMVLGRKGIDAYIRYGGTMSPGGYDYNHGQTIFSTEKSTNEYIDSAIAKNIQHSLKNYQDGGHFRALIDLYEKDELTSAINRVIEDMNHRFTVSVLTDVFKSHDLGVSARNLRHDREHPADVLDRIDVTAVTGKLKNLLEIRNKEEQKVKITPEHVREIQEYLRLLDIIDTIDVVNDAHPDRSRKRIVFTQPGMRYSQAAALIGALMQDEMFRSPGIRERNRISGRILDEVRGRMMEDIVLLETKAGMPDRQVFVLQFAVGEFDMVVADPKSLTCCIYEIKHSQEAAPDQVRHLIDREKCAETEKQYGDILGKFVIYRGADCTIGDIRYLNVEEYLKSLGKSPEGTAGG